MDRVNVDGHDLYVVEQMQRGVTVHELSDVSGIPVATIRYHCRVPHGQLYGIARRVSRIWMIPADAADRFAVAYTRYGSMRKTSATPNPVPSDSGSH